MVTVRAERLLTTSELAFKLAVTRSSVYRWARQGRLPAIRVGRLLRFDPDTIARLADRWRGRDSR